MILKPLLAINLTIMLVTCFNVTSTHASTNNISNLIPSVPYFSGRNEALKALENYYNRGEIVASLVGIAGIGKSQIARKFAMIHQNDYKIIWFFDYHHDLATQFQRLAQEINTKICAKRTPKCAINTDLNKVTDKVMDFLKNESSWLIVYDNLAVGENNTLHNYIQFTPIGSEKCNILVTAQEKQDLFNIIDIKKLNRAESLNLLQSIISYDLMQKLDLNHIANTLSDYPLSIVKVGTLFKTNKFLNMEDYKTLNLVQTLPQNSINHFSKLVLERLSPDAKNLLRIVVLLDNHSLSKNLLYKLCELDKSHCTLLNFTDSVVELTNYSIIEAIQHMNPGNDSDAVMFEMHGFLQQSLKDLDKNEVTQTLERILQKINSWISVSYDWQAWSVLCSKYPLLLENFEALNNTLAEYNISKTNSIRFKIHLLGLYQFQLNYAKSASIIVEIDKWLATKEFSFFKTLNDREMYANYYLLRGEYYNYAKNDFQTSLRNVEKVLGVLHGDEKHYIDFITEAYSKLSQTKIYTGHLADAQKYIKLMSEKLGDISSSKDLFYFVKAKIQMESGLYKEALENINKSIQEERLLIDYVIAPSLALKAEILCKLDKPSEALSIVKTTYNSIKTNPTTRHEMGANTLNVLALITLKLNNTKESLQYIKQSIQLTIDANRINYNLGIAYDIKGDIYFQTLHFDKAMENYIKAAEIFDEIYETKEVDHLSNLYYKIAITALKLHDILIFNYYYDLHKQAFGTEHIRSQKLFEAILPKSQQS